MNKFFDYIFVNILMQRTSTYKTLLKNVPNRNFIKIFLIILTFISIYLSTYLIVCVQKLIDTVANVISTGNFENFNNTVIYILVIFALSLIMGLFIISIIDFFVEKDFVMNTSKFIIESFYKQNFNFVKKEGNDSGVIAYKMTNDVDFIAKWLMGGALQIWRDVISIFVQYYFLFLYSKKVSIFCALSVLFSFLITRKIIYKMAYINKYIYDASSELNQFFLQSAQSHIDVKQLNKEDSFISKMLDILENRIYYYKKKMLFLEIAYNFIFSLNSKVFPIIILVISFYLVLQGKYSVGIAIAIYQLVILAQEPLISLANNISSWKSTMVLTERLDCFMPPEANENKNKIELTKIEKLDFYSESFSYPDGVKILKNVKFELKPREILCIKGQTGVGKSTLSTLLMRFEKLNGNSYIKINGLDINEYSSSSYYKLVNILSQTPYIFQDKLIDNITLGENYPQEFLNEVIKTVQLEDFVEKYGWNHFLDENANNISGGQRQRIGLARILLRKPQLIILDEPTAALDNNTAKNLVKDLISFKNKYNMTIVVITHSDSFDVVASQTIKLK